MPRLLALSLALLTVLASASAASAKPATIVASSWKGKLIVIVDGYAHHERHAPGVDEATHAHSKTVMSGKARDVTLPYRAGRRHWTLSGGGSLRQLTSDLNSTFTSVEEGRHNLKWTCRGGLWNSGQRSDTMQFRTEPGYSGALRLEVDGFSMVPKETCEPGEGFRSPIAQDGWPDDFVYGLPSAPQSNRKLELMSDWWTWRANCGLGDDREGSGTPPGDVHESTGDETCVSGAWVHIQTLLDLKRTCKKLRIRTGASSARGRCLKRS